jgi:hypothetical protein
MTTIKDGDKEEKFQYEWLARAFQYLFHPAQRMVTFASKLNIQIEKNMFKLIFKLLL